MANTLSKSLGLNLADLAEMIRSKGRGKDTVLAHITPKEAALLKNRGGRGSTNPDTGLLEFQDDYVTDESSGPYIPENTVSAPDIGSISQDPTYYGVPDGGQYQPYVDPSVGYTGPDFNTMPQAAQPDFQQYPTSQQPLGRPQPTYTNYVDAAGNIVTADEQRSLGQEAQALAKAAEQKYAGVNLSPYIPNDISSMDNRDVGLIETLPPVSRYSEYISDNQENPPSPPPLDKDGKPTDYSGLLSQLLRLGLGAGTAYALTRGVAQPAAKTAADQAQQAKTDRQNIATPYQNIGKGLINAAQAGNLSASNIQAVKAAKAMAAQNISRTGGVGVLQGANSIADLEARLLDNQLTQGVKIANIGDNYAIGAIQAGQAADQALAQSQANFANQLATMLAPMVLGYAPQIGNQAIKSAGNLFSNPSITTTDTSTPTSPSSGEINV